MLCYSVSTLIEKEKTMPVAAVRKQLKSLLSHVSQIMSWQASFVEKNVATCSLFSAEDVQYIAVPILKYLNKLPHKCLFDCM